MQQEERTNDKPEHGDEVESERLDGEDLDRLLTSRRDAELPLLPEENVGRVVDAAVVLAFDFSAVVEVLDLFVEVKLGRSVGLGLSI